VGSICCLPSALKKTEKLPGREGKGKEDGKQAKKNPKRTNINRKPMPEPKPLVP